ncbi:ParB/RepB/Spo0J family partition protein [Pseudoxanthomonas sp. USHLN014]|uniref:ParB/RepB/Spo0J family partition protein n=1 Tax=Pseudoxanthomonas sp. USHLN014 TaxID=3081297 RepID=UPI00301BABD4
MQLTTDIIAVPLSHLSISPTNSRKHRSATHVAATWESLKVHGQLQNLVVGPAQEPGRWLVDAGGTRLLAFQLGLERGEIGDDHPVLCKPIADTAALEASTAENTIREAMHPADQFRAFRAMVESGKSTAEVAAHFSVAESVVAQRLKLANVQPELFALYEQGAMNLEQLQALALTDDHSAQHRAWFGQKGSKVEHDWQRQPHAIRERITAREVGPDNPMAKFVNVTAYQAAGGAIRKDLFSDAVYFADAKLLQTIAQNQLEALAEQERQAGWSWAEAQTYLDYAGQARYGRGPFDATRRSPNAKEKKRLEEISAQLDALEDGVDEMSELQQAFADELRRERAGIRNALDQWSDEAKAKTGVLIYLDKYNGLQVERGRLKPGQKLSSSGNVADKASGPKKATLSADMLTRLEMHRAAAVRLAVATAPEQALVLLLEQMVLEVLLPRGGAGLAMHPSNQHNADAIAIRGKFGDVGSCVARQRLQAHLDAWGETVPGKVAEVHAWLVGMSAEQRLQLLAALVACTIPVSQSTGPVLAQRLGVDIAAAWQATPETYLSIVPKSLLAEAVTDVAGKAAGEVLLTLKKDAAIAEAGKHLANRGWLPKPLRGQGYALRTDGGDQAAGSKATPAAKSPSPSKKRPAAKKAAKKGPAKAAKTTTPAPKRATTKAGNRKSPAVAKRKSAA